MGQDVPEGRGVPTFAEEPGEFRVGIVAVVLAPALEPGLDFLERVFEGRADEDEFLIEGTVANVE